MQLHAGGCMCARLRPHTPCRWPHPSGCSLTHRVRNDLVVPISPVTGPSMIKSKMSCIRGEGGGAI